MQRFITILFQNSESTQNAYNEDRSEIILEDLSRVLSPLVSSSPWAPIVSTWSLDCLGKLSTKWSSRICGKQGPNSTQLLHEKMSAWLGCSAARVLVDLAEDCLAKLMDSKVDTKMENTVDYMMSNTESCCVATLLETSVKHTLTGLLLTLGPASPTPSPTGSSALGSRTTSRPARRGKGRCP